MRWTVCTEVGTNLQAVEVSLSIFQLAPMTRKGGLPSPGYHQPEPALGPPGLKRQQHVGASPGASQYDPAGVWHV